MISERDRRLAAQGRISARYCALKDLARELDSRAKWNEEQHEERGRWETNGNGERVEVDPAWSSRWKDEADALREAAAAIRALAGPSPWPSALAPTPTEGEPDAR